MRSDKTSGVIRRFSGCGQAKYSLPCVARFDTPFRTWSRSGREIAASVDGNLLVAQAIVLGLRLVNVLREVAKRNNAHDLSFLVDDRDSVKLRLAHDGFG